jgi:hypothetical protein
MKPIVVNEGNGYFIRAYRLESKANGGGKLSSEIFGKAFEFVVVEQMHPNYGYFADGMFWWRSMHTSEWTAVVVANNLMEFEPTRIDSHGGLGEFLEIYPDFKELFKDIVQEPSVLMRGLKKIKGESNNAKDTN